MRAEKLESALPCASYTCMADLRALVLQESRGPEADQKSNCRIMDALWTHGACIRSAEFQEAPARHRPAGLHHRPNHGFIAWKPQTGCPRRVKKVRQRADLRGAQISRDRRSNGNSIDELLSIFGGRTQPVMAHLIDAGKLTLKDVQEAERALRKLSASAKATADKGCRR